MGHVLYPIIDTTITNPIPLLLTVDEVGNMELDETEVVEVDSLKGDIEE